MYLCLFLWLTFTLVLSTQGGDSFLSCASVFFFQCVWTSNWTRGFGYWIRTAILCFILRRKLSLWLDEPCFSWLYLFFKIRCCNANSKQIKSSSDCTPQLHFLFFFLISWIIAFWCKPDPCNLIFLAKTESKSNHKSVFYLPKMQYNISLFTF